MSDQTVLPPEPWEEINRGRGGAREGSGRPFGRHIGFTRTMRDALLEAMENLGGPTVYLTHLAAVRPELYVQLLGRAMPIRLIGDDVEVFTVKRVERVVIAKK